MNYKVIVFNNAEEIEKALNEAYKEGYETGYDDCFNEADDFFSTEEVEAKEELRKKHEAELDKVGHEAYEEGKRVGNEEAKEELRKKHEAELDDVGHRAYEEGQRVGNEEGYQKGFEAAKQLYGGLTTISGVTNECCLKSEGRCTDAVSHINL